MPTETIEMPATRTTAELALLEQDRRWKRAYQFVAVLAVVMGLPALAGGFLSGDDVQLVRDHVLVNRPSLDHWTKLFSIVHRDLYQPVAMWSLSLDWAWIRIMGLEKSANGVAGAAWMFHLTNVGLHALNTVLVCMLIRRWQGPVLTAVIVGGLFAVHPLAAESVAWISGRMMLLSTTFALAAVNLFDDQRCADPSWRIPMILVFVTLCMMTKVRVSLPLLMLAGALITREGMTRWAWSTWFVAVLITGGFAYLNYEASAGLIAEGSAHLQGSRIARSILAVGWYVSRVVAPLNLAPMHPAPATMSWMSPGLWPAALAVVALIVAAVGSIKWTRAGWVGAAWFLASLAVTLPLIPSRNVAFAERYTYLPNVGMFLLIGVWLTMLFDWLERRGRVEFVRPIRTGIITVVCLVLCATSWHVIGYYRDNLRRTDRVASVYPNHAGMAMRHVWALYHTDAYDRAIQSANDADSRFGDEVKADVLQAIGMSRLRRGEMSAALVDLQAAVDTDPEDGLAHARLGTALDLADRTTESIAAFERCVELLPNYNPGLVKLASLYQQNGQPDKARERYEQALTRNTYDVKATLGIAELDIAIDDCRSAIDRLQNLLTWMPNNAPACVNLGVCLARRDASAEAITLYRRAIKIDPDNQIAVLNLAHALRAAGEQAQAQTVLMAYLERNPSDRQAVDLSLINLVERDRLHQAATMVIEALRADSKAPDLIARYAWLSAINGEWDTANEALGEASEEETGPWIHLARCTIDMHAGKFESAIGAFDRLADTGLLPDYLFFHTLMLSMEACTTADPAEPWPYFVVTAACLQAERQDAAERAAAEFRKRTSDPAANQRLDALLR